MGSIYPVKGRLYRVKRKRLSPLGFAVGLVIGLVIIYAGFMGPLPETRWIGLFFGILIIVAAAINALRVHEVAEPFAAVKEIEVGPKRIIFRCEDGEEIIPQIQKITVGVFEYATGLRSRSLGVNWMKMRGHVHGETLSAEIRGRAKRLKGKKELVSLKDDLQHFFGSKVEEKKVRFVA